MFKRIIALICTLAICFSLVVFPAFAEDYTSSAVSYWDAIVIGLRDGTTSGLNFFYDGLGDVAGKVVSNLSSNLCGSSDDGLHHADHLSDQGGQDSNGQYVNAKCKFCGDTFRCYGADISDAYDDYVKTNSGGNNSSFAINSSGQYIVYLESMGALEYYRDSGSSYAYPSDVYQQYIGNTALTSSEHLQLVPYESEHLYTGSNYVASYAYIPLFRFTAPFNCNVAWHLPTWSNGCYADYSYSSSLNGARSSVTKNSLYSFSSDNAASFFSGESTVLGLYMYNSRYCQNVSQYVRIMGYRPLVSFGDLASNCYAICTPLTSTTLPGSSTRPSTIIKNVYNISNNTTINNMFNETNNTYIDASTGDTYNVTNWEYNYASRFYSFTYDDSDSVQHTVVITYADDFVVVTDNGTTSYYYYGFDDGGGSGGGGSSGGDSSGDSSGGGSGGGSSIDYTPVINDIIEKLQTLIERGDANSEYLKKVMEALDSINSNTKDTYLILLDLLNRINTGLSYTDDSGKTYTVSELAYYIYRYLQENLDTKVSGISALLEKILIAIESISPNINVDVDIDGDGETDSPETWFSNFLGKFNFLGTLYDCAKQLVADVTGDAASAQAVADGIASVDDLQKEHAVSLTSAEAAEVAPQDVSYTVPEMLLNFPSVTWQGVNFGNMSAIDLSWYAPYKSTVDNIVSGFLWLGFLWLLIKRAPGIIQGSAMAEADAIKIQDRR